MLTCIFGTTHPSYCYADGWRGTLSAGVGSTEYEGWGIWFNPPELDFQETLHVCGGDSSIGWGVLYALCNRSTISKSVQTRFLKLLGMLSTSCKYRYQNIIHIKKHSTLKNLVLEILVLYTKFNILLSLENIFVRWYRANKNNPINCINCII